MNAVERNGNHSVSETMFVLEDDYLNKGKSSAVPSRAAVMTALKVFWKNYFKEMETHVVAYGKNIDEFIHETSRFDMELHFRGVIVIKPCKPLITINVYGYDKGILSDIPRIEFVSGTDVCPAVKSTAETMAILGYNKVARHAESVGLKLIDSRIDIMADPSNRLFFGDIFTPENSTIKSEKTDADDFVIDSSLIRQIIKCNSHIDQKTASVIRFLYGGYFSRLTGMRLSDFQRKIMKVIE